MSGRRILIVAAAVAACVALAVGAAEAKSKKGKTSKDTDTSSETGFDVSGLMQWAQVKNGKKGLRSRGKSQSGTPTGKVQRKAPN